MHPTEGDLMQKMSEALLIAKFLRQKRQGDLKRLAEAVCVELEVLIDTVHTHAAAKPLRTPTNDRHQQA